MLCFEALPLGGLDRIVMLVVLTTVIVLSWCWEKLINTVSVIVL